MSKYINAPSAAATASLYQANGASPLRVRNPTIHFTDTAALTNDTIIPNASGATESVWTTAAPSL